LAHDSEWPFPSIITSGCNPPYPVCNVRFTPACLIEDSLGATEGTIRLIGVAARTIDGSDFLGVLEA
jgi:hypothetical protein